MSFATTPILIEDLMEGSADSDDFREPRNPLATSLNPIVKGILDGSAPAAETGIVSAVEISHEGVDTNDSQDASRTTAEAKPIPKAQRAVGADGKSAPVVLIVEDTMELAEVIQATLERMNMVTIHETHGGKALNSLEEVKPDVVLLDIALPDMTGWKILDTLKEKYTPETMPAVIVITAYGDPANRLVGKLQGVFSYLIKPFTSDEVEEIVKRALNSEV